MLDEVVDSKSDAILGAAILCGGGDVAVGDVVEADLVHQRMNVLCHQRLRTTGGAKLAESAQRDYCGGILRAFDAWTFRIRAIPP